MRIAAGPGPETAKGQSDFYPDRGRLLVAVRGYFCSNSPGHQSVAIMTFDALMTA